MIRQIRQQASQDKVLRRSVQRRAHEDHDELRDEDADAADFMDGNAAENEADDPDECCPGHHGAELLPVVAEEALVDEDAAKQGHDDGEDDRGDFVGVVWVERPVVAGIGVRHVGQCLRLGSQLFGRW